MKADQADLKSQLDDANRKLDMVLAVNDKLIKALAAAAVVVPELDAEPQLDDEFAPQIEGEAGGMNVKLQPGRHVTVNGKMVLTHDEIAKLIADGVGNALKAIAAAFE